MCEILHVVQNYKAIVQSTKIAKLTPYKRKTLALSATENEKEIFKIIKLFMLSCIHNYDVISAVFK